MAESNVQSSFGITLLYQDAAHSVKESEREFQVLSLYLDPHQNFTGSILGRDSSSI